MIKINLLSIAESPAINNYPKHSHDEFEIVFAKSGKITIDLEEKRCELSENDIMIIPPRVSHTGVLGDAFINIYAHVKKLDFSDIILTHDNDGSARTLFLMLHRVMSEKEDGYREISDKLLDVLCEFVKKYSMRTFKYDFVLKIKNLIYENIDNPSFHISDEVRRLGFCTDYFRRCFAEEMGKTPLAYMTSLRIERAKNLLVQRFPISVESVAERCGFSDSFYFSKLFKKHTGLSPLAYRKKYV